MDRLARGQAGEREGGPDAGDALGSPSSPSAGSSGLGTRAVRWALLGSVLGGGAYLLLSPRPGQSTAAIVASCVALAVALIALTKPGEARLPRSRAFLAAGAALGCVVLTLAGSRDPGLGLWTVDLGGYVFALLVVRGHPRVGGVGGVLAVVLNLGWAVCRQLEPGQILLTVGHPLLSLIVGFVWFRVLQRIAARSRTLGDASARAELAARITEEAIAQSQRELSEIGGRAAPLFERIAGQAELSQADRDEARVLEAELRDWLRSPDLAAPAVAAAAAAARGRGIEVVLLGSPKSRDRAVDSPIFRRIADLIDTAEHGRVTVRRVPRDPEGRVTLLLDGGTPATTRRWELSERDGVCVVP